MVTNNIEYTRQYYLKNKEKLTARMYENITSDAYYDSDYDSHYDSDWSMNNPEECAEAFHAAAQMIEDMENESMK